LLMQKIQCEEPNLKDALSDSGIISSFLEEVLSSAFETGQVNLRQIFKPIHNSFSELSKGTYSGNNAFVDGFNQLIDIAIKLFIAISGTEDGALETLIRIKNSGKRKKEMEWFFKEYGSSMLQYLVKLKVGESTRWLGKYDVQASQNPSHSARLNIYPINDMEANTEYFYDTLINYIEKGSYNKNSREYSY
jgi:hypothetical protein